MANTDVVNEEENIDEGIVDTYSELETEELTRTEGIII